jgi:O-antigen ligase
VAAVACLGAGVAILAATAALGLPLLAPAVALALLAVPLLLVRPVAVLVLATVAEFANLSTVAAVNGLPGGETVALVFAALATLLAWRRGQIRPGWSPLVVVALLYLLAQVVSALANQTIDPSLTPAAESETNLTAVLETAKALLWPLIVGMLLLVPGRVPEAMARAIALTLALLAALTMVQEFVIGNATSLAGLSNVPLVADVGGATARHAGPQGDANFWGRVLALGLPFALSLAQMAGRTRAMLGWLTVAASICGGIVLTGSRGALLAAFLVGLGWALLAGGRWAKAVLFAPIVGALALFVPGVGSRLATLSLLGTSDSLKVVDPSLEGRLAAQRVAVEVFVDHPVLGVGPGNFLAVTEGYLSRLALDTLPLAPHNQYLEAAAEGGLLGLAAWLILLGGGIFVALRARLLARSGGPAVAREAPVPLSNAVLAALAGWAVASVFLHLATFRTLLFVVALGAALDIRARRRVEELRLQPDPVQGVAATPLAPSPTSTGLRRGRWVRYAAAALAGLLLLGAAALWTAAGPRERTWSASSSMQLVSVDEGQSDSPAYDLDTLSRTGLVRTLAGIVASPRFAEEGLARVAAYPVDVGGVTVEVTGSVRSALVVVTATGPDPAVAGFVAEETRLAASDYLNDISPLYGVRDVAGEPVIEEHEPSYDRRWALVPLGVAALLAGVSLVSAVRARRREGRRVLWWETGR